MKWTTREGKEIEVKDMTSSHAENCVLMLMRNNGPHKVLEALLYAHEKHSKENQPKEVELNGDMAQEFNDMMDDSLDLDDQDTYSDHLRWYKH